jgi:5-methylcytosine-specific restriction endonuclease McrA
VTKEQKKAADRAYYLKNRAKIIAQVQAYRQQNLELVKERQRKYYRKKKTDILAAVRAYAQKNHEAVLARRRNQYVKNHARERAQQRQYQIANIETIRASKRVWNKADRRQYPEKYAANAQARRARVLGLFVEKVSVAVLLRRDRRRCGLCQKLVAKKDASIDHIVPISRGGEHSYRNTHLAHLRCNKSKGAKLKGQLRLIG